MKIVAIFLVVWSSVQAVSAALTGAEIAQIESEFGITLTANQIAELNAVVYPTLSASWRTDAYSRIEANRKANLDIQVVDMNGDPVEGASVSVRMKSNQFRFGGTFSAKDFNNVNNNLNMSTATYKQRLLSMFNAVGLNNGFKPRLTSLHQYVPGVLNWAAANDLPVRGHLLIWPGTGDIAAMDTPGAVSGDDYGQHLSEGWNSAYANGDVLGAVETYKASARTQADKDALEAEVDAEILNWVEQWNVYEWDVINETLSNRLLMDILGYDQMAEWFNIAENNKVSSDIKLLINEFQIISAMSEELTPGYYTDRRDRFMANIDQIIAEGGQIDRIGFQSRIKQEHRDPQLIYDRLVEWGNTYGKEMVGTEFEVKDIPVTQWKGYVYTDEERAQITEEMMTQYFSHPLVTGFFGWDTITDDVESLIDYDGQPTLHGLVWYYLHRIRFNTDATLASSLNGQTAVRGYKGAYDITVSYGGQDTVSSLVHTNDQSIVIQLTSSVADDHNTGEVIDAWHYDALADNASLSQGISTGTVGGVSFNNTPLATIQHEAVRWQSDGVAGSIYRSVSLSSYASASSGRFQLAVDFLDADFSTSATLSNGVGRVNFGFRSDPTGARDDAYFRLVFVSGGGTNAHYRLDVRDEVSNNLIVGTFPGTTLNHLAVRALYDLDTNTFNVYYRHDGGAEVLAHSGSLVSDFALDQFRNVVQTYNGAANWAAGDRVFTDNLIVRKLNDPAPTPQSLYQDWIVQFSGLGSTHIEDNLRFYAVDADPSNPLDTGNQPLHQTLENALEHIHYEWADAAARGLTYTVQTTDDLVEGVWVNQGMDWIGSGALDATFISVTNQLPTTGSNGFIRVNIEFTP